MARDLAWQRRLVLRTFLAKKRGERPAPPARQLRAMIVAEDDAAVPVEMLSTQPTQEPIRRDSWGRPIQAPPKPRHSYTGIARRR